MTPRQRDALAFIVAYQQQHGGASPSYAEIARQLGLKSRSGAHLYVHRLVRAGHIRILPNSARSIEVLLLRQPEREFLAAADAYAEESRRKGTVGIETAGRFFAAHAVWRGAAEEAQARPAPPAAPSPAASPAPAAAPRAPAPRTPAKPLPGFRIGGAPNGQAGRAAATKAPEPGATLPEDATIRRLFNPEAGVGAGQVAAALGWPLPRVTQRLKDLGLVRAG